MINGQGVRALLGKRIQFYRKQRQLSQAALAEKANISITFLSKIERGIKYPTSESISGIANGLGVEVCELFQADEISVGHRNMLERFKNDVLKTVEEVYKAYGERMV
ncbi:MAG: helix-turn-helix domain-containing protein [Treponema sp.]|jgi:transcriptional regulator with XRE-family HTH domain|nr:helix-turn-helix domain-containing protein [Treponema sp.]